MEIFLQSFQYVPFLNKFYLIYFSSTICVTFFCRLLFKNEVIDEICTVLCKILKNAQVCIYSLADVNIFHCVELTFLEGKLDWFLVLAFLK